MCMLGNNIVKIPYSHWGSMSEKKENYLASKMILPYDERSNEDVDDVAWKIKFDKKEIEIDFENRVISFPRQVSFEEFCYSLRMILDGIMVREGCCPAHAAAINYSDKQIILSANTNEGKSFFANKISNKVNGARIIGDDHILFSKDCITGNNVYRIRQDGIERYSVNNRIEYKLDNIILMGLVKSEYNNCEIIYGTKMIDILEQLSFMKYLLSNYTICGKEYSYKELFSENIKDQYISTIVSSVDRMLLISGSANYVEEKLLNVLEG